MTTHRDDSDPTSSARTGPGPDAAGDVERRTLRRSIAAVTVVVTAALVLSACGGGDSEDADAEPVIVVEDGGAGSALAPVGADGAQAGTDEEQALAFAACMRDEGLDFPDPTIDADGSVAFLPADAAQVGPGDFVNDPDFESALEVCGSLVDGAAFLPGGGDTTELEDGLLEAAECLREQGIDVADPDLSGGIGAAAAGPFGDEFDPSDPDVAAALESCQSVFTDLGVPGLG